MKKIKKQVILLTLTLILILLACNAVSAADNSNNTTQSNNSSTQLSAANPTAAAMNNVPSKVVISGKVLKCSDGTPFSGVTVTASKGGTKLASTTTGSDGTYTLSFLSSDDVFNVTASYPGHVSSIKNVAVASGAGGTSYGAANFKLGLSFVYVSPSGSDSHSGNMGDPVQTVRNALSLVSDNGYIFLGSGTYAGTDNVNLTIDKSVTILRDGLSSRPILDAKSESWIFSIKNGANVTLGYLILANGKASNGGAIYNVCGNVTVINCTFTGNSASNGGAIYNYAHLRNSVCTFTNCTFTGNSAQDGSVVYNDGSFADGTCTFNSCTFTSNSATGGGAIYNNPGFYGWDNCYINYCTFENNSANNGSAIYNKEFSYVNYCIFKSNNATTGGAIYNTGTCTMDDCTFKNNRVNTTITEGDGAAIYNLGTLTATLSTFEDNTAESGAIWNNGTSTIEGCTFTNNHATKFGGAIENYGTMTIDRGKFTGNTAKCAGVISNYGSLAISNSTFIGNTANHGGVISNDYDGDYGSNSPMNIISSVFRGNSAKQGSVIYCGDKSGTCEIHFNTIYGNTGTYDIYSDSKSINATKNWWGDNFQGTNPQSASRVNGNVNANPWVILTIKASPAKIDLGGTSTITADLNHINGGGDLDGGHIPDGPITLNVPWGSLNSNGYSLSEDTVNGVISPVIFYANGATVNPSYNPVKVTASADGYTTNEESAFITIRTKSDLSITKTGPANVTAGNQIIYIIAVNNKGQDYAADVVIRDTLPENISNIRWTAVYAGGATGPASGNGNLNLNLDMLPKDGSCIINITGTVLSSTAASTVLTNTATVSTSSTEINPLDNSATADTTVDTHVNLVVSKTGSTTVTAGNKITYTITVTNNGPSDAQNVQILDVIPAILQNVTHDSFNIGTIGAGQSKTVTITGTVPYSTTSGTVIKNSAAATSDTSGTITASGTVQTTVDTQSTLTVDKTGLSTVTAGETCTGLYTITVASNGPSDAQNVIVTDNLPFNVVRGNYTINGGSPVSFSGNNLIVNLGALAPGATVTIVINGEIASSTSAGILINTANVHTDTGSAQNFTSNQFSTTVNTQSALNVVKESLVNQVVAGVTYTDPIYRITVRNEGLSDARDVQVIDSIPSQIVNREYRIDGGTWTSFTGDLNQLVSYIASGSSSVIEIRGKIISSAPAGSISNNASASVYGSTFNSTSVITSIVTSAGIDLNETVNNSRPNTGDTVTFTVTAHNNGPSDALNVQIQDLMPSDFINVTIIPSKGTYNNGIWTLDLTNGETATLTLTGVVSSVLVGKNTTNTASYGLNSTNATIYVPKSDLYIKITASNNNPKVGEKFLLTYKLGNYGPDDAENVTITFKLPEGLDFVKVTADTGNCTYDPATRTVTWTIDSVPVGDPYLYFTVKAAGDGTYKITPDIDSSTYNSGSSDGITINVQSPPNKDDPSSSSNDGSSTVRASSTINMQETGVPLNYLMLAIVLVLSGLVPKRK
ncbi:right-handed parallel beta-helix repeat-containing protein [Methanobacterium sp. MBAC-LM]|uniref:COG1361 S-layer family protein n=1 Tax=Methanobacterium sp. MBAC-LM TaxID=3412034 RepID=UPI003C71E37C